MITINEYFEGGVRSLGYVSQEGRSTVGVMDPGAYRFDTSSKELVRVLEGELAVLLPGESDWKTFGQGEEFNVPANVSFEVKVGSQTSYLCKYS